MDKKKSQHGGSGRGKRKRGSGRGAQPPAQPPVLGGSSSRLLLTRLLNGGQVWEVFVATTASERGPAEVRLEFERKGPGGDPLRHSRPLAGALLEALHAGDSLSRHDLDKELERAIRDAAPGDPPPEAA